MSQTPIASTSVWRATDLEAIRVALSIPARLPAIRAINDAMADLEQLYPDAIPTARRELDAIAAIDTELAGLGPEQLQAPIETRRKTVGPDALPEDGSLPVKKADVIEYDTELLREEITTRYGEGLSIEQALRRQRGSHAQALLLMLPTLAGWSRAPQLNSSDTPMDCQALGAPWRIGQEGPDLVSSATMAENQRLTCLGACHHLQPAVVVGGH